MKVDFMQFSRQSAENSNWVFICLDDWKKYFYFKKTGLQKWHSKLFAFTLLPIKKPRRTNEMTTITKYYFLSGEENHAFSC